uniref:Translation initiation factor IF-2, chloroplastic n=1 Tax=Erythroglossum lusitanicum TaxID=2575615 RepID=A0A4D6WT04_9FLOR|nr:Translation initiation factor 2 [Erythroglossum lusitanicum]
MSIQELSYKLNIPEAEIITYLFLKGISTTINQVIDISIAKKVALKYDFNILDDEEINQVKMNSLNKKKNLSENSIRAPIVTIFGHVDHGKTTLLDYILKTNCVSKEYGGITQAITGYEIDWLYNSNVFKLVFLDTPGHEAFSSMRLRAAKVTDIALLVIAADDGLRPQTIESIKYILEMQLSYIIIINKIDKTDIDVIRIKEELSKYNILSEEWGGDALIVEVSAITGKNIELLLSNICLLSNCKKLTANPNQYAEGTILESNLDKQKGIIANIIIQNGTLKIGDIIIAGNIYAKVKSLISSNNIQIPFSGPSSIVKVLGFSKLPESGILFNVVNDEKQAKQYIQKFSNSYYNLNQALKSLNTRVTLKDKNKLKQLSLIIKTDTLGSLEAILNSLSKISQKKVQINIIAANSGNISSTDIELALTTKSILIGFNIDITNYINNLVKKNILILKVFNVIYNLLDYIENCMMNLIEIEYKRVFIGRATVQTVFYMNKGSVAGCVVNDGKLRKMSFIIVYRDNNIVYEGKLNSLKHLKDDVEEVFVNKECGLMCDYNLWQTSDIIESYDLIPEKKSL